ncbi:optineurin [Tautogolabrus adspersus]
MASGVPMINGDISRSPGQFATLEETLQQMNILIQENRDLKEALHQTNLTMKERFEGLSVWREKQREERGFLENRLEEARGRMEALTLQNQDLSKRLGEEGSKEAGLQAGSSNQSAELDALRAQVIRLQAEKNDLVAMNSELQLKAEQDSHDDSFIEVITVTDGGVDGINDVYGSELSRRPDLSMTASRMDSEEQTVSQLLQSLRNETQRAERLQAELQTSAARISQLMEQKRNVVDSTKTTQTETAETKEDSGKEAASEVENLKSQMMALFKELQQAQSKLDEAEGMKKNLQDRCREVEQDVATLKAQLVEKQAVQSENNRLKLQLDSMQAENQMEQRKAGEERNNLAQLKDAYTKLFEDYNELKEDKKKRECQLVQKEVVEQLQERLTAAEKALASKQTHIDEMKQEIFQKEKDLETISVFQAQAEVYSSDFYAERAAREKLHEERERLAAQLEYVKKQNAHLQDEMDSLGRRSLNEMQLRHGGGNAHGAGASLVGRGTDWQHQGNIPEHACPKCNEILPDLDSLQIHIMDCIN